MLQVLVTVFSRPQLQAVLARMERRGKELGREPSLGASGRLAGSGMRPVRLYCIQSSQS